MAMDFVKNKLNTKIVKSITHHNIYCDNFNSYKMAILTSIKPQNAL